MRDTTSARRATVAAPDRRRPVTGEVADAVVVPTALARRVADVLRVARLHGGIFTETDGRRWTFLTTHIDASRPELLAQLARFGVRVSWHGAPPCAGDVEPGDVESGDGRRWIQPPTGALLPWQAVLATVWRLATDAMNAHAEKEPAAS